MYAFIGTYSSGSKPRVRSLHEESKSYLDEWLREEVSCLSQKAVRLSPEMLANADESAAMHLVGNDEVGSSRIHEGGFEIGGSDRLASRGRLKMNVRTQPTNGEVRRELFVMIAQM